MYDGWLVFFPLDGELAIASDRETTQSSFDAKRRRSSSAANTDQV
jgi:hypothetical protein